MLELFDMVRLKEDDKEHGVKSTYDGTVVDVLADGEAYTVEFFDESGETVEAALFTEYTESQLVKM